MRHLTARRWRAVCVSAASGGRRLARRAARRSAGKRGSMRDFFTRVAARATTLSGHYLTFLLALAIVVIWAASGPVFGFSDTWQLVINTGTTIVTFLMVFLIQHAQNRDATAMHLKLDELLRAMTEADTSMIQAEDRTDEELDELKRLYAQLCDEHDQLLARLHQANGAAHKA
jgi:low affinity Fe/Cu permease